jgi:ABC-type transport system involved in cytochrome bd biosynthesis fused ATPase/permease subunit
VPPDNSPTDGKSGPKGGKPEQNQLKRKLEAANKANESAEKAKNDAENVFKLNDIDFSIPRGQLVAIVGAVGSGKTSLLQGLIGEMRRTSGSIMFGGSVAYSSQSAWIQVIAFLLWHLRLLMLLCSRTECDNSRECLFWSPLRRRKVLECHS